jgi:hypothetical protein
MSRDTYGRPQAIPRTHVPTTHRCVGTCPRCGGAVEAAEYDREWGAAEHGDDMDDRAGRDVRGAW